MSQVAGAKALLEDEDWGIDSQTADAENQRPADSNIANPKADAANAVLHDREWEMLPQTKRPRRSLSLKKQRQVSIPFIFVYLSRPCINP